MQSSQLTALQNAKLLLEQCGCFRGPPGPTGPQGPEGPAGKTLFYYSDGVTNDPNSGNIDGCIYGLFIGADGTIWRSQATTQIDSSFTASYLNGPVNTITKQADGKILVGGAFTLYGASSYNYLLRFNSDGTVDTSFSIGTGFDNSVGDFDYSDITPFDPSSQPVKPFVPATEFNPDMQKPFGSTLDAPLG